MSDPVLRMQNAARAFKKKQVLEGVDLEIPAGSVVGLLGKNGAGKTTLIKCALGLLRLHGGESSIFGQDSWDLDAAAKARLGYVPQVVSLYPWMKVRHLIAYTASFYPRWNDGLVDRLVTNWELEPNDRIGPLSVGQLQKLAIVLALGHEPDLLVLDEPVASLDPGGRREFLRTILEMAMTGERTVLFSTHITSDLERVADRVAILKDGRIAYCGELDALKDQVKRLCISAKTPLPGSLDVPGALHEQIDGSEAVVSVEHVTPEMIDELARTHDATVEVQDLNLEDIFLEMHHDSPQPVH